MDIDEAIQHLDNLPTTEAIADELVSMGITAQQGCPDQCALAHYFHVTTDATFVAVSIRYRNGRSPSGVVGGMVGIRTSLDTTDSRVLSPQIGRFAAEFDRGYYPKLVEER